MAVGILFVKRIWVIVAEHKYIFLSYDMSKKITTKKAFSGKRAHWAVKNKTFQTQKMLCERANRGKKNGRLLLADTVNALSWEARTFNLLSRRLQCEVFDDYLQTSGVLPSIPADIAGNLPKVLRRSIAKRCIENNGVNGAYFFVVCGNQL